MKPTNLIMLEGVKVSKNKVGINMIQFIKNTLLICQNQIQNVLSLKSILQCFEVTSELHNFL